MKRIENLKNLSNDSIYDVMLSPVCQLLIIVSSRGIHRIFWQDEKDSRACQQSSYRQQW